VAAGAAGELPPANLNFVKPESSGDSDRGGGPREASPAGLRAEVSEVQGTVLGIDETDEAVEPARLDAKGSWGTGASANSSLGSAGPGSGRRRGSAGPAVLGPLPGSSRRGGSPAKAGLGSPKAQGSLRSQGSPSPRGQSSLRSQGSPRAQGSMRSQGQPSPKAEGSFGRR